MTIARSIRASSRNEVVLHWAAFAALSILAACSGGSEPPPPKGPDAPTAVAVSPANGAAVVSWTPSAGATSYNVYFGTTATLTTSSAKITATGSPANVPALANGVRKFFAVSAVNANGESALAAAGCAVPTASSTTFGADDRQLTLYDPLCADRLDSARWWSPGAYSVRVSGGAAELRVDAENLEPRTLRNANITAAAAVNGGLGRVTTLSALVEVPSGASRTGGAEFRTAVRFLYSPPLLRLNYPAANRDLLVVEVGLATAGAGLHAYRNVFHCDDGACTIIPSTGVAFVDPPEFAQVPGAPFAGAAASYDTPYRVTARLDEATGVFHWTVAGGTFGAGVSGTADPTAYLDATPSWAGVPLAGQGFWIAQILARAFDPTPAGGGSAAFTARVDDVHVGLNGGGAALHDDFGGIAPNSGPAALSLAKWTNAGAVRVMPSSGGLTIENEVSSVGFLGFGLGHGLVLSNPEQADGVQADVSVPAFTSSGPGAATGQVVVQGRFHNDGSGTVSGNAVGDVFAGVSLGLDPTLMSASYFISRWGGTTLASGLLYSGPLDPGVHPMRVGYDRDADAFTFGFGEHVVTVPSPTGAGYVAPARAPMKRIFGVVYPSTQHGTTGALEVRVNNVFTWSAAAAGGP